MIVWLWFFSFHLSASPPVFHNCPKDDVVMLQLPEGKNYSILPFQLFAVDYNHRNLSLSTNFPFYSTISPSPIHIVHRYPKSPTQHLVYQATDDIGKTTTCSFSVELRDMDPPSFKNCPPNMVSLTSLKQQLWWSKDMFWHQCARNLQCFYHAMIAVNLLLPTDFYRTRPVLM